MRRGGFVEVLTIKSSETCKNADRRRKRQRTPEEKYGKYKWLRLLIRRNSRELSEVKQKLRGLNLGLSYLMDFDSEYLVGVACKDSRDKAILAELRAAGVDGISPKQIHLNVRRSTGLKYHHISRRIRWMNARMEREIGQLVAEKVGRKWALSRFMRRNWGAKVDEVEKENTTEQPVR